MLTFFALNPNLLIERKAQSCPVHFDSVRHSPLKLLKICIHFSSSSKGLSMPPLSLSLSLRAYALLSAGICIIRAHENEPKETLSLIHMRKVSLSLSIFVARKWRTHKKSRPKVLPIKGADNDKSRDWKEQRPKERSDPFEAKGSLLRNTLLPLANIARFRCNEENTTYNYTKFNSQMGSLSLSLFWDALIYCTVAIAFVVHFT